MDLQFSKSNTISVYYSAVGLTGPSGFSRITGEKQYSVDLGTILYNNSFLKLNSLVIPLKDQIFFDPVADKNKYAAVNVYYDAEYGQFVFDRVAVSDKYIRKYTAAAIPNVIPIAQFIIRQAQESFEVISYNEYSQMSTFTITDDFEQGDTGVDLLQGDTGPYGPTGLIGDMGYTGLPGDPGFMGLTGVSLPGSAGEQGGTGVYVDTDMQLYLKFKTDDRRQTDYSPYERDCFYTWTGIYQDGTQKSYYLVEPGPVDNCHNVVFNGEFAAYRRNEFLEFGRETGTICAWIRTTDKPRADFTYTYKGITGIYGITGAPIYGVTGAYRVSFKDTSGYSPTSWKWIINYDPSYEGEDHGIVYTMQNVSYTFPGITGTYIVKLVAGNLNGSSEIVHFINLPLP
jgi:hypothetical protein